MDNLTHTLTGLALSRAGLNRFCPQATWILLLAANAPDADVVSALAGPALYLDYHRHLTHAFIAVPLMALLPVALVRLFSRRPIDWKRAWVVSMLGVLSHLLLDLTNLYGIRLALPFSHHWSRLDTTSVVDLWIWVVLILSVFAPLIARLVGSEIGESRGKAEGAGRGWAMFALAFLLLYNAGRSLAHQQAIAVMDSRVYDSETPLRIAAFPGLANPFRWRGLVETESAYSIHDVNLFGTFDPVGGEWYPKPPFSAEMRTASETPEFRAFLGFVQYPLWASAPAPAPEGATRVQLFDLRFGSPRQPGFVATAAVSPEGHVIESSFSFGEPRPR